MQPDSLTPSELFPEASRPSKPPRAILEGLFAFPPNREILGGTSYFIVENAGNILIDCPAWEEENQQFILQKGGVRWLFLTHRGGISKRVKQIQQDLKCEVIIQEQEAYLLPELKITIFEREFNINPNYTVIWTSGHSPGSSCLYWNAHGGILFTGRHLLPDKTGKIQPLRTAKTFHWFRQLQNVKLLSDRFTCETLHYICPGANTGFLRGKGISDRAPESLNELDLEALKQLPPIL
jgi:glyoxylase-like metal-dependent hydrolase (beta-lactamase superfamily II)